MSRKKKQEEELAKWAQRMGYKFGPDSPDPEALAKLCRPEMRDILRHIMENVRPANEVRIIRKHAQLNRLKATGKLCKDNVKAKVEHTGEPDDTDELTADRSGLTVQRMSDNLTQLTSEVRQLGREERELSDSVRRGLRTLGRLGRESEALKRDTARLRRLEADVDMFQQLMPVACPPYDTTDVDAAAEREVVKCLEEAETLEESKMERGANSGGERELAELLRTRVEAAVAAVPPRLLFRALVLRLERSTKRLQEYYANLTLDCNEGLNNLLFVESQKLHVERWRAVRDERRKLADARTALKAATLELVESISTKLMADSLVEELGDNPEAVKASVLKWVENEVNGTVRAESTRRYNSLADDLTSKALFPPQATADGTDIARSVDQIEKLIEEQLVRLSWHMSYDHTEYKEAVERSRAATSGVGSSITSSSLVDSMRNRSTRLDFTTTGGGDGSNGGCLQSEIEDDPCLADSRGGGEGVSLMDWVIRRREESRVGAKGDGPSDDPSSLLEGTPHSVVASVLEKIRLFHSANTSRSTLPIYDVNTTHKTPLVDELSMMQAKNAEAVEAKLAALTACADLLESRAKRFRSIVKFWIEQPLNEHMAHADIDELKDFEPVWRRMCRAVDHLIRATDISNALPR